MNGREALKALADGKKVRRTCWQLSEHILLSMASGLIIDERGGSYELEALDSSDWELAPDQPATDGELIAEMERLADELDQRGVVLSCDGRAGTYRDCARMLRERKVAP